MNKDRLQKLFDRARADRTKSAISWTSATVCELLDELVEQAEEQAREIEFLAGVEAAERA